jgi:rsbT co-antagonist protein RsbR
MNNAPDYMTILKIDNRELKSRLAFFELTDEDFARLASLRDFANKYTHEITEALYDLILGHPETKPFFPDENTVHHVKGRQNAYFLGLFSGKCDLGYVENRLKVGAVHEDIGMPPKWYLGAYRRYLSLIYDRLIKEPRSPKELSDSFGSIKKLIFFDMSFAIDTYIAANLQTLGRHQAAIRELSTPVIKVYDRVLLLPIVGTVDTQRAQQIMEAVLTRVVQDQAMVIILDIAGVPVVDTKVADHLIKTTAAVRLLGAQTILTGISAMVARTVVQLGVDITMMHTRTRLADGITLALDMVGKRISDKDPLKDAATN